MASCSVPTLEKKYVKTKIANLNCSLGEAPSVSRKEALIVEHIKAVENDSQFCIDPEFPPLLDWFNTPSPLSFSGQLQGKIVVLDFFTYCCINCMHILPDLEALESRHPVQQGVLVIGVHSAKFGNEKMSDNIRNAINRYGMTHPVVNDMEIELWERLGVTCWPTLVIIGPQKQLLHYIIGEGHGEELQLFMDVAVQYYAAKGGLDTSPIPMGPAEVQAQRKEVLKYPGKVCFDDSGEHLFVADSSNHRILMMEWSTGKVSKVFGSGLPGLLDGEGTSAQFNTPQGMTCCKETLYVADTDNHSLRKINLATGSVSTLVGTGKQGKDKVGGAVGVSQEISSPWDVELGKSPGSESCDVLYVAMAGTHQIWVHFLQDATWTKGSQYSAGTTLRLTGSGEEANRNNSYPHKAAFAQPSGISTSPDQSLLYVADSESSTIRGVALPGGSVKALVGGAIDPLDLFTFGDRDGKGRDARLQHPLGVACRSKDGQVYVADSYNHKIKVLSPGSKNCVTLAGAGAPGMVDGGFEEALFSEPGGLCVGPEGMLLVVADTNNHAVRVLDLEKGVVTRYQITFEGSGQLQRLTGRRATVVTFDPVPARGEVELVVLFAPPTSCHWTEDAPSAWQILPEESAPYHLVKGQQMKNPISEVANISLITQLEEGQSCYIQVEAAMYFCETDSGTCHMQAAVLSFPLIQSNTAGETVRKSFNYSPTL